MIRKDKNNCYVIEGYAVDEYKEKLTLAKYQYGAFIACICIAFLAMPFVREMLERYMLSHMLIQLPLLALCGMWIGIFIDTKYRIHIPYNQALPLLIIALLTAMFWMLPRALDSSLEHGGYFFAKFLTLPLLLGMPLAFAIKNIGPITKAFFIANIISMLVVLAWLYIEAPIRLCNYYLIDEQKILGMSLLYILGLFVLFLTIKLFIGTKRNVKSNNNISFLDI